MPSIKITHVILFLLCSSPIRCQGEQDKKLCNFCKCSNENDLLTIDCIGKSIEWSPQKLTEAMGDFKTGEEGSLVLILNNNHIPRLEPFPNITFADIDVSLAGCGLVEMADKAFGNIKTVRYLNLGYNKLTGDSVRGNIFAGPFNINEYEPIDLEMLNLEHNEIHSLPRKMFVHLPNLKSLYLNNNPFKIIDSVTTVALSSIKRLEVLDMSHTDIATVPDGIFHNMRYLKQLYLSGNRFKTVPETIGSLGNTLELLILNNNRFEELTDNSFLGLWRLDSLELGEMETLKRVRAGAFIQLKSLRKMFLCDNRNLEYIDREAFRELKAAWPIKELHLHNNNLHGIPTDLAPWSELTALNLDRNPWECDCGTIKNMTLDGLMEKLSDSSDARCLTPLRVGGRELKTVRPEEVCSGGPSFRTPYASYARPSNLVVAASVVVIVLFAGVLIGVRVGRWRRRLAESRATPVRYANIRN